MRHAHPALFLLAALAALLPSAPSNAVYFAERVASGFDSPVSLEIAPGDSRLFVVERPGRIFILDGASVLPAPFLDITDRVYTNQGEQGLLGLAFPPDHASSGLFYVYYTRSDWAVVLSRFSLTADPDVADPTSEEVLFFEPQPGTNHNGGQLSFGPDGALYVGIGDGSGDPNQSQNTSNILGTIIRIDVSNPPGYSLPLGNPDLGPGSDPRIWVYGLRNPWRFSFDRLTDDLFIADVGAEDWEEVNLQPPTTAGGENYGWPILEGPACYSPPTGCAAANYEAPILTYDHGVGFSIIGGYRYRGSRAAWQGLYFFADFTGTVFVAEETPGGSFGYQAVSVQADLGSVDFGISCFGQDVAGEIYLANVLSGEIHRLSGRDLDDDGLLDENDNCPAVANPSQADTDSDGIGDACDDACGDGLDNDSDGFIDWPSDPGCADLQGQIEDPECDDGVDNDGDNAIDWDGGGGGGSVDPECVGRSWHDREAPDCVCGLGPSLALMLPLLAWQRRRRVLPEQRDTAVAD